MNYRWTAERRAALGAAYQAGGLRAACQLVPHLAESTVYTYLQEFGYTSRVIKAEPAPETVSAPSPASEARLQRGCRLCGAPRFTLSTKDGARECRDPRACAKRLERGGLNAIMASPRSVEFEVREPA